MKNCTSGGYNNMKRHSFFATTTISNKKHIPWMIWVSDPLVVRLGTKGVCAIGKKDAACLDRQGCQREI
jgi:hypothetical protein